MNASFKEKRKWIIAKLKNEMPKISLLTMQTSSGEELNIIGERCIAELLRIAVKKFEFSLSLSPWWVGFQEQLVQSPVADSFPLLPKFLFRITRATIQ